MGMSTSIFFPVGQMWLSEVKRCECFGWSCFAVRYEVQQLYFCYITVWYISVKSISSPHAEQHHMFSLWTRFTNVSLWIASGHLFIELELWMLSQDQCSSAIWILSEQPLFSFSAHGKQSFTDRTDRFPTPQVLKQTSVDVVLPRPLQTAQWAALRKHLAYNHTMKWTLHSGCYLG